MYGIIYTILPQFAPLIVSYSDVLPFFRRLNEYEGFGMVSLVESRSSGYFEVTEGGNM